MDKYIVIKIKDRTFQVSYIYYGNIFNGLRCSKQIGSKHELYFWAKEVCDKLISNIVGRQPELRKQKGKSKNRLQDFFKEKTK